VPYTRNASFSEPRPEALSCRAASINRASCLWDDYPADLGPKCAQANCNTCHSLDYIPMNSVFLDRKGWEGEVNKMIKVTDAPIKQEGVPQIVDYLAAQYGK
jgi:hypothetical protein